MGPAARLAGPKGAGVRTCRGGGWAQLNGVASTSAQTVATGWYRRLGIARTWLFITLLAKSKRRLERTYVGEEPLPPSAELEYRRVIV